MDETQVVVVGAGPVGLAAALLLARQGMRVDVCEKAETIEKDYRASTFHAGTLDLLESSGITGALIAMGLTCPTVQFRNWAEGKLAELDHRLIAGDTRHPYRIQCEQFKLSEWLAAALREFPLVRVHRGAEVTALRDLGDRVEVEARGRAGALSLRGDFVIGADGGRSTVRKLLNIDFPGFTYPERILVLGTTLDLQSVLPDLATVNYVADPDNYAHILRIPDMWRLSLPLPADIAEEDALKDDYIVARTRGLIPGFDAGAIAVKKVYHVHQRVAATYGANRVLLAGDAAHLNNPKGGMGLNGGLHDAYGLVRLIAERYDDGAAILPAYEAQRRPEAIDAIHKLTQSNYEALKGVNGKTSAASRWRELAADPAKARQFLLDASMITSLRRCGLLPAAR